MEACQVPFQVFIDSFDPSNFLEFGNKALESLENFHLYTINQITVPHVSVLLKIVFLESQEKHKNLTFFASKTLEILAGRLSEKLQDEELFIEGLQLLNRNSENLTSCGYFGLFLKPLIAKKNKGLETVLNMSFSVDYLLGCVESWTIGQVVQEIIENFPGISGKFIKGLIELVKNPGIKGSISCEVIKKPLASKSVLSAINEDVIFGLMADQLGYGLKLVRELLNLPCDSLIKKRTLSTLFKNCEVLSNRFEAAKGERLIDLLEITRIAISSDFANLSYLIGNSRIIDISTVMFNKDSFFSELWSSQLHLAYYSLLAAAVFSGSNTVIESMFRAEIPKKLVFHSMNPNVCGRKGARKGFMGFITKIGISFRDSKVSLLKGMLKNVSGWDRFLIYVSQQEAIESRVLGARPRYRHLTADEISEYMSLDRELVESPGYFYCKNYWSIPLGNVDFL